MIMLGMNKPSSEEAAEIRDFMKRLRCPIGCAVIEGPEGEGLENFAGSIRSATTIVLTDLYYSVVRSSSSTKDRLGEGLNNLFGYSGTAFVYVDQFHGTPLEKLQAAACKVVEMIKGTNDKNVTVHVWLSFGLMIQSWHRNRRDVIERKMVERIVESIRTVDSTASRPCSTTTSDSTRPPCRKRARWPTMCTMY